MVSIFKYYSVVIYLKQLFPRGISHSALSDMQTISQEAPSGGNNTSSRRDFDAYGEKPRGGNRKDFFDEEFEFVSSLSSR